MAGHTHARQQCADGSGHTATPYPADRGVHHLVAEQAARTPGQVAVECGDDVATYADLAEQADRLAHHLRAETLADCLARAEKATQAGWATAGLPRRCRPVVQ